MAPKLRERRSASSGTEPKRKSARLNNANQAANTFADPRVVDNKPNKNLPTTNNPQREIHVVVDGDEIADIINKMALRCIRSLASERNHENVIVTFQERALEALEDLYTRVDGRAEWAKTRNRGSFPNYTDENDEDDDIDELMGDEEAEEARRRKARRGPIVFDVDRYGDDGDEVLLGEAGDVYCFCQKKEHGRMYCCANKDCVTGWFHEECIVKLMKKDHQPVEDEDWLCPVCVEEEKFHRRTRVKGTLWVRRANMGF